MAGIIEATDEDFQQRVIDRSAELPVVVDFWAPWCGPCRSLGPVLERLADEADGGWELVKVNVDDSPGLSVRYGIQGIPAVKAFQNGAEVAQFVGAQPRAGVEAWLRSFLPDPSREIAAAGAAAEAEGRKEAAKSLYEEALKMSPDNEAARNGLARLALIEETATADEGSLLARLNVNPLDLEAAVALSKLRLTQDDEDFYEPLLAAVSASGDGKTLKEGQQAFLDLINVLSSEDPRASRARRRLASVLYR